MGKRELRKIFLERRAGLSPADVAAISREVSDRFFDNVAIATVKVLHCYLPIEKFNEPNTKLIFERLWSDCPSITTTVPRVDFATGELTSVVYSPTCPIVQNKWGVLEPEGGTLVDPDAIDIAVVPMLCFDERGFRVGYGKGFYDRLLAKCRPDCKKVGLSFFPPVDVIDDIDEFDIALDICIAPEQTFTFPK